MDNLKEIILHLDPLQPHIKAEQLDTNGNIQVKYLDSDTLAGIVQQHIRMAPVSTGLLPPGILSLKLRQDRWTITQLCPFDRCDITYHKTVFPAFPLPNIALQYTLDESGVAAGFRLAVLDRGRITPDTSLYTCPFPNVNVYSLCTGSNTLDGYDTLAKAAGLPYRVMALPFGDDYYSPSCTKLQLPVRQLLEYLADKQPDTYYREVLIANGQTLGKFLEG